MFSKVLIANRGEIAVRIIRTLHRLGVRAVAVYSEPDAHAVHVRLADEAVCIGPAAVAESYLNVENLLAAARRTGAEAIHPGYGFLSENADFADACAAAGLRFIGPTPEQMRRFGRKHLAREIAQAQGVPLLPGTGLLADVNAALAAAPAIGYPVMLKSTAGGGGIGLRVCRDEAELADAFASVQRLSQKNFADGGAYLEKYLEVARHVEVQIFGDGRGAVLALGERDCSTQRRNQKVIEETPAPALADDVRAGLVRAAVKMGRAVAYESAGTVELVVDARTKAFYFLEVNTRLQVEHGVTEAVTGIDLVAWMVQQAAGELVLPADPPTPRGAAIQVRLYAEDPAKDFRPSAGLLTNVRLPGGAHELDADGLRCDSWVESGTEVSPHYDPLLAKLIAWGPTREAARARLAEALAQARLDGIETNLAYLREVLATPTFTRGEVHTRLLEGMNFAPRTVDVLEGGTQTTVQDWPGRLGHWAVGVPPSGPMDDLAFRAANRLVGNPEGAPALEITLTGPTLRFRQAGTLALTGAAMRATLDGVALPHGVAVAVPAGATVRVGTVTGRGARAYLAVRGGLDVPSYLGSASTFLLGRFGGHGGRALRTGDVLHVAADPTGPIASEATFAPTYPEEWELAVLSGPHGAPDFFRPEDIAMLLATAWQVHHNSDRTGVRLIGPKPQWARPDGGEAGLHPSNIHDNAYAVGTVDFTGDMPILLGPDGPSLGGFVCPLTVARADRWKLGQLKAGDRVRFVVLDEAGAAALERAREAELAALTTGTPSPSTLRLASPAVVPSPITDDLPARADTPEVVIRRSGDDYLLVELGPAVLDVELRLRVHALMQSLQARRLPGIVDLTPGIRSLQVHFDPARLPAAQLRAELRALAADLPSVEELVVPTRTVHLPLSWEDPATLEAIAKYMRVVRADAPWCPSNIEFIRRINGLASVEDVRRLVFDASYLVLGLGDVYLGAPVATPLDPRHRLVTTKYNPARTWTPENAVGIGGAYMCIYGMEGPGGYQFVGRTVQVWNTHRQPPPFAAGAPWLLRFFDQIRFYPVSADELLAMREELPYGRVPLRIEEGLFSVRAYRELLAREADSIAAFRRMQRAAFLAERDRWKAAGQDLTATSSIDVAEAEASEARLPPGCWAVESPLAGNLWRVVRQPGERVAAGDTVVLLEAMKTEISVVAHAAGVVREVRVAPGQPVRAGQTLLVCADG